MYSIPEGVLWYNTGIKSVENGMGFWIFMVIMDLLIPATMLVIGQLWRKRLPKNINPIYGFRTARSMKSRDTWEYAHN